ncbi:MAG: Na+/H+ antiporter subunit E [Desulfobacterales bacterium]
MAPPVNAFSDNKPGESKKTTKHRARLPRARPGARVLTFLVCFATWIVLSGRFDLFHLLLGVIASCIVSTISADILFPVHEFRQLPKMSARFILYLPWLLYKVFQANLNILYLTFHPRMHERIDPQIITFQSRVKGNMALLIFANSITLTPGTVTVHVSVLGKYTVHAIDGKSAEALPGRMEQKVEQIFE